MRPGRDTLDGLAEEYARITVGWNQQLDTLERTLARLEDGADKAFASSLARSSMANAGIKRLPSCANEEPRYCAQHLAAKPSSCSIRRWRRRCARTCGSCGKSSQWLPPSAPSWISRPPSAPVLTPRAAAPPSPRCSLVATRHLSKTGGASVRDWMLQIERVDRGRFFGPVTWMPYRGRCDGNKRFMHCCHPDDPRPVTECQQVWATEARAIALAKLAATSAASARAPNASSGLMSPLTLLEFHWPDSALGPWGEPYTFLEMLPYMRPEVLPGCRVIVTTVLRDPLTLYPSLQRHQYLAMREYGPLALKQRCACNLTACDVSGFVRAFPNFQAWRLTSSRWLVPPLELVGHDAMLARASRLLARLDVVGIFERLDDWLVLICRRAAIAPCGMLRRLNAKRDTAQTKRCAPSDAAELAAAVQAHARADVQLHAIASRRFARDFRQSDFGS